ncbi:hypothetical protein FPV67DRAFT_1778255 [Lyophyllum atratum]|nr:hypothetical protein FPV67DRAFT_1778255 [Lyophyllum atratum]
MDNSKPAPRPEPKIALITPSASPPSRPFFPKPYRIPDQASPTKRPRLSSAPRQFTPRASSSSSSAAADAVDIQRAREESTMRLLDIWSGLADHYSLSPDEDDIIDIRTGELVKDRGVLRGSQTMNFGAFTDAAAEDAEDEEDEDDEVDELDSFANPGSDDIDLEVEGRRVPPVTAMDPRDAEDLRDFLEAERRRKEIYGSEVDDTEDSAHESPADERYSEGSRRSAPADSSIDIATPEVEEDDVSSQELDDEPPHRQVEPEYIDSGSDDELGNWDQDEASAVYRLPKAEDSDDEVEIVDFFAEPISLSPEISFVTPLTSTKTKSRENLKQTSFPVQRQLQTPPQSQTSSIPSATPDDYLVQLPPDSSSPPRSSSPFPSQYDSSPIKPPPPKRPTDRPRSEKKRAPNLVDSTRPIPRLDLTKLAGGPPIRAKSRAQADVHAPEASGSGSASLSKGKKLSKPSPTTLLTASAKKMPESKKSKVEVVIERRPPFQPTKASTTPLQTQAVSKKKVKDKPKPKLATTDMGKGKQKSISADDRIESFEEVLDDNNPVTTPSSPISVRKGTSHLPRARSRRPSASESAVTKDVKEHPPEPTTSAARKPKYEQLANESASTKKRKRVVSSAETDKDVNEVPPSAGRTTQTRSRNASTSRVRHHSTDNESAEPDAVRKPEIKRSEKRASSLKQSPRPSNSEYSDASSQEGYDEPPQRHFSRAPSHFGDHPYYPYAQPPYPPPHPHDQQPHMYAPIPDPRAQYIITQAMQQLSALVGGPWTPPQHPPARGSTPYTPSHHHHHPHHHSDASGSMYSTPVHHPHPYPYSYNPSMSNATLPPDSSPLASSSSSSSSGVRHKSLVKRSRSRGRRVSFMVEEGAVDTMEVTSPEGRGKGEGRSMERGQSSRGESLSRESASVMENPRRGKEKASREASEESASEAEPPKALSRGRSSVRSQTPGPPAQLEDARPTKQTASRGRNRSGPGRK